MVYSFPKYFFVQKILVSFNSPNHFLQPEVQFIYYSMVSPIVLCIPRPDPPNSSIGLTFELRFDQFGDLKRSKMLYTRIILQISCHKEVTFLKIPGFRLSRVPQAGSWILQTLLGLTQYALRSPPWKIQPKVRRRYLKPSIGASSVANFQVLVVSKTYDHCR